MIKLGRRREESSRGWEKISGGKKKEAAETWES